MTEIDAYLSGQRLYGDDWTLDQIAGWYEDEREGYAGLVAADSAPYKYAYHALNRFHAFRHLRGRRFSNVLGFGSAFGDEFQPILKQLDHLTIVDPSDAFVRAEVHGVPADYIKPQLDGRLPFPDAHFDLITCFGVLHHIPNVSAVVAELARTLRPGGALALREPLNSMGDWRHPRRGLTKRERGIPLALLQKMFENGGLRVVRLGLCEFPLTPRLFRVVRPDFFNSAWVVRLDAAVSRMFGWNIHYHPRNLLQRFRPISAFFLLEKAKT